MTPGECPDRGPDRPPCRISAPHQHSGEGVNEMIVMFPEAEPAARQEPARVGLPLGHEFVPHGEGGFCNASGDMCHHHNDGGWLDCKQPENAHRPAKVCTCQAYEGSDSRCEIHRPASEPEPNRCGCWPKDPVSGHSDSCKAWPENWIDHIPRKEKMVPPAPAQGSPTWTCQARTSKADPPQDCDWPHCGCDPHAEKVMAALEEEGWRPPERPAEVGSPDKYEAMAGALDGLMVYVKNVGWCIKVTAGTAELDAAGAALASWRGLARKEGERD